MSSSATWSSSPAPTRVRPPRRQRVGGLNTGAANPTLAYLAIGFVVGLLIGLPVLGWWLWPVRTTNAVPSDLAPAYREAYVAMAADSYALSGDLALAKARLGTWGPDEAARIIASLQETAVASGSTVQTTRLQQLSADLGLLDGSASAAASASTGVQSAGEDDALVARKSGTPLIVIGAILLASGLVLGGYLVRRQGGMGKLAVALRSLRKRGIQIPKPDLAGIRRALQADRPRRPTTATTEPLPAAAPAEMDVEEAEEYEADDEDRSLEAVLSTWTEKVDIQEPAEEAIVESAQSDSRPAARSDAADDPLSLGVFMATYRHGSDKMFDISYYLSDEAQFLGECGVGVAETVGDAIPEQACAMELWLFDKGDIRTHTKLLVTDFALDDPDLREVLAGRGELVRAAPGQIIHLETAQLRLQAEVLSVKHGDAPSAPARAYFDELTLELRVHLKG